MKLPALIYGHFTDVKPRCRKMVTALKKGTHWNDASGELIDSANAPGFLVLDGPSTLLDGEDHFHCFAPARAIEDVLLGKLPDEQLESIVEQMIATPWGVLSLLGQSGYFFLHDKKRHVPFLRSVLRFWDDFAAQGTRYTTGSRDHICELWTLPAISVDNILAKMGTPLPELRTRETADDLLRLISRALGDETPP